MTEEKFIYKAENGNTCEIVDTFAEMFPLWAGRVLITADNEKWALTAAAVATGFATSVIMSPAEASLEGVVSADKTPDNRVGALIQIYNRNRFDLKNQMITRIGQCIMTCPTTSAFDALPNAKRKLKVGRAIRLFGDGFQRKGLVGNRKVWKIPVMEGDFIVEDTFGVVEAVAGGNFLIMAKDKLSGLKAAEEAVNAIKAKASEVIMPFPGGICRSGSKAGSLKYKLKASTNHPFCPGLRTVVPDSQLSEGVNCVYEIVVNGLTVDAVKKAMSAGVKAAASVLGVVRISAGNYGGKLGPYKAFLKEVIGLP
ncbi:MAG: formylmethanofuran--tetrahydromethanopterin N-formyltransferase [Candidatus Bathyarchaeota archaeon]|jgi:formylmethanofuran--tetrahydromethanopterin N-formyltransferase|nr:formylmethanofuran--tetrahydromethanopterin N-formyltransferase [Candidatus Bathyarchaeota archaeon A05DMB-5]MDH7558263.1 formylmethanofuran--tetrahydromethanopterin N-formyltransferase [Candidatus Bathyarchaeota archaeon]